MSNETMYIFFPLKIISYPQSGYSEDDRDELSTEEAVNYEDIILAAIKKENYHIEEFLVESTLKKKVGSLSPSVEVLDDKLWGVMTVQLNTALTSEETATLISQIEGQNRDGWGKDFERRRINTPDCEIYVRFHNSNTYMIKTEQEFRMDQGQDGLVMGGLS
ncbi:hypothetical protein [Clostridium sp. HBUAS56010]|uniref:hypothetical protein n=1 Tax=Clostridium sp. HBUAS56010 TaxID=2571127 RepID=UPI0011779063|nr:hypothetical protein [Clostridium sp. HBUAS56010]